MKKHSFLILAILLGVAFSANAQVLQFGLKFQYATSSIDDLKYNLEQTFENKSTETIKHSEAGLLLRINAGRWITIQPEANFSISAVWDSVDQQGNFFQQMAWAFNDSKSAINLSIPILVAVHLIKIDNTFDIRAFGGPQFYTTIKGVEDGDIDFKNYSLVFGASVDLLSVLSFDARIIKHPDSDIFYSAGVALLF